MREMNTAESLRINIRVFLALALVLETSAVIVNICPPLLVSCPCGNSTSNAVHSAEVQCPIFKFLKYECKLCGKNSENDICAKFQYCEKCNGTAKACTSCPPNRYGIFCEKQCSCLNGGRCLPDGQCNCPQTHAGQKCQKSLVCSTPKPPVNGSFVSDSPLLTPDSSVTFSCDEGFEMNGIATIYCLDDLHWSAKSPECERVCSRSTYQSPKDGFVQRVTEKKTVGSMLVYTCRKGFALSGSATRVCLENGTWSGRTPTCERLVFCDVPSIPKNSEREIKPGLFGTFSRGTTILYSCLEGYRMIGKPVQTCTSTGKWNSDSPICFFGNTCQDPGTPKNSQRKLHSVLTEVFLPGSAIEYECDILYYMIGMAVLVCENGTWSRNLPSCLKLTTCMEPEELPNGYFDINPPDSFSTNRGNRQGNILNRGSSPLSPAVSSRHSGSVLKRPTEENVETLEDIGLHFNPEATIFNDTYFNETLLSDFNDTAEVDELSVLGQMNITEDSLESMGESNTTVLLETGPRRFKREAIPLPSGHHHVGSRAVFSCESRYYNLIGSRTRTCNTQGKWSGRPPTCIPVCGKSSTPKTPFVINGTPSSIGQWPWQVGIAILTESKKWFIICGGSIINERWVITAAHCVTYDQTTELIPIQEFRLFFGKYYRNQSMDDNMVQSKEVSEILIHSDYDPKNFESDIALIKLTEPVILTARVQPVCLPESQSLSSDERVKEGKVGTLIGWGMKETGKFSAIIQYANIPVISNKKCEEDYRNVGIFLSLTWNMLCAGYEDGRHDSCTGDSGGPLVFPYDEKNDRWVLEGIVSWGSLNGCGKAGQYGGYTRVQRFLDWIHNFIHQ